MERDHDIGIILRRRRDAVAGLDAKGMQAGGSRGDRTLESGESEACVSADQRIA